MHSTPFTPCLIIGGAAHSSSVDSQSILATITPTWLAIISDLRPRDNPPAGIARLHKSHIASLGPRIQALGHRSRRRISSSSQAGATIMLIGLSHVSYTSDKIKKSRSYRVYVEWSPPDVDTVSTVTTHKIKASIAGRVEWAPLSIKRFFALLPQTIVITIQERALHLLPWSPLSSHKVSCLADQRVEDQIDGVLGVRVAITQPEAASEPGTKMDPHQEVSTAITEAQMILIASQEHNTQVCGIIDSTQAVSQSTNLSQFTADFCAAFPGVISAVEGFLKLGGLLSEVHPIAKVIVDVLHGAYIIVKASALVDERMGALLASMNELCTLTRQYASSQKQEHLIYSKIESILIEVQHAAALVRAYAEYKKKSGLKCPTYFTSFQQDADAFIQKFNELCSQLTAASVADIFADVQVIKKGLKHLMKNDVFSVLPYAFNAAIALHDGSDRGCLPGTRTAILDALQAWAVGGSVSVALNSLPNSSVPNTLSLTDISVLWLLGVAGSGKSSIAVSLAKYLHSASVCTAYYHFEAAKQHHLNPSNLFTTIALQLAAQDAGIEAQLLALVRSAKDLQQRSEDPAEQLERFLLPLLKGDSTTLTPLVIIIDALDESGGVGARKKLLKALTSLAPHLPSNVHILITSRPELDILNMVEITPPLPRVSTLFTDALPNRSTNDDIYKYVNHMLEGPPLYPTVEQLKNLADKAQLSFQWASTACLYIVDQEDGNQAVHPSKRLKNVLSSSNTADSQFTLYRLYSTLMDAQFGQSQSKDLELLRLLLGTLVAAREPLSLDAMLQLLHVHLSQYGEIDDVKVEAARNLGLLSSLISGTRSSTSNAPLLPLHASLLDFLQDSLHTSFLPNYLIPDLPALIQEKIGETLSYACHFWASHFVSATYVAPNTVSEVRTLLSTPQFLHWLEVMSLTCASPTKMLSLIAAEPASGIAALVTEALLFTTCYAIPMALSTPHIYLSAVPFIPTISPLQRICKEYQRMSSVQSMAVSRDGVVAAGLFDGAILLWNMQTGQQRGDLLKGHSGCVVSVAFSHDGAVLASGSHDETIQLWDVQSHAPKGDVLIGHRGSVLSVAFSHDGALLASGYEDKVIQLWDVQSHTPKGDPLWGHSRPVLSVAFSHDGAVLASGSLDETIQLWDVQSHKPKGDPLRGHTDWVQSVAFSPDGTVLASGSIDKTIQLWDVQSHKPKGDSLKGHSGPVWSVAFSPDGALLASGSNDKTIQLWDVQSQTPMGNPLRGHSSSVWSVAFSHNGAVLASSSHDKTIHLWDVQSHQPEGHPLRGHSGSGLCVAFSPDGAVLASGSDDRTIQLWDAQSHLLRGDLLRCHSGLVLCVAFSHDGTVLASGSIDKTIQLWDVQSQVPIGNPLRGHSGSVWSLAFSHNGTILASGSHDETIQLWDVQSHAPKGDPLRGHSTSVFSVAFSPDGTVLASGSEDQTIQLWDVHSHIPIGDPLKGHSGAVQSVAFSPDGTVLASGSSDQTIQLWDVQSHTCKGDRLRGHSGSVCSVAFSPDGAVLASGSDDETIQMWNVQSHAPKGDVLIGHRGSVLSVAFSHDALLLASGSSDKTVRVWNITSYALCMVVPIPNTHSPIFNLDPAWPELLDDGWVQGPNDELILWVPPSYRTHLYDERLIAVLGEDPSSRVRLNFDNMVLGEDWAKCYTPLPT
ncbi:WD40 repeat-like protein [Clavulina sp. PMI_390]|nr:WD40 repeat-like protein [Clavulina sp. PMI_390]